MSDELRQVLTQVLTEESRASGGWGGGGFPLSDGSYYGLTVANGRVTLTQTIAPGGADVSIPIGSAPIPASTRGFDPNALVLALLGSPTSYVVPVIGAVVVLGVLGFVLWQASK